MRMVSKKKNEKKLPNLKNDSAIKIEIQTSINSFHNHQIQLHSFSFVHLDHQIVNDDFQIFFFAVAACTRRIKTMLLVFIVGVAATVRFQFMFPYTHV
jgi:hypothetical protein